MKRKRIFTILVLVLLTCALSTTAFAIDESEVESAIAASSQEEVAGNIFIWFLCAIGFLKVSQKIDSFMASLGVNVGRTGGSMLAELMVAVVSPLLQVHLEARFLIVTPRTVHTMVVRQPAQHLPVAETALSGSPNELWVMLQHQVQQVPDLVLAASLVVLCSAPA